MLLCNFHCIIAYKNNQQNVDSDNLLLALIKQDNLTKKILKKNDVNIKEIEWQKLA